MHLVEVRAPSKFLFRTLLGAGVIIVALVAFVVYAIIHPIPFTRDWVRTSSPLHAVVFDALHYTQSPDDDPHLAKVRELVLQQLPRGSPDRAIRQYISDYFHSPPETSPTYDVDKPYICIKAREEGAIFAGSGRWKSSSKSTPASVCATSLYFGPQTAFEKLPASRLNNPKHPSVPAYA